MLGICPKINTRDEDIEAPIKTRRVVLANTHDEQLSLFLEHIAGMRLKTFSLQIDTDGIFWLPLAMQLDAVWLKLFLHQPALGELQLQFIYPREFFGEDNRDEDIMQLVRQLIDWKV